ncbi:MAG: Fe-S cluster biogenesis protein NfuA [Cognaticolwellia sp.]|jgi:Fe-S cluster biogenesis protein NfuA
MDNQLKERIEKALDSIRPHLAVDGGDVEVVNVTDNMCLRIKWLGNCENCFMSVMTMKAGIEQVVMAQVPEILSVEAINGVEMPS